MSLAEAAAAFGGHGEGRKYEGPEEEDEDDVELGAVLTVDGKKWGSWGEDGGGKLGRTEQDRRGGSGGGGGGVLGGGMVGGGLLGGGLMGGGVLGGGFLGGGMGGVGMMGGMDNNVGGGGGSPPIPGGGGGSPPMVGILNALKDRLGKHDSEEAKLELMWQKSSDGTLRREILQSNAPLVMLYVSGTNNNTLRAVHSLTRCNITEGSSSHLEGRILAFTLVGNNVLVTPQNAMWEQCDAKIPDGLTVITADDTGRKKVGNFTCSKTEPLPKAILAPTSLMEKVYQWIKGGLTTTDCYEILCEHFPDPESFSMLKTWLLAAGQCGTSQEKSQLAITMTPADAQDEIFEDWQLRTLTARKVIEGVSQQQQSPGAATPMDQTMAVLFQQSQQALLLMQQQIFHAQQQQSQHQSLLFNQLQHSLATTSRGTDQGSSATTTGKRNETLWAKILSLAHVTSIKDLPNWWAMTEGKTKQDIESVWDEAKKDIVKWARRLGYPIHLTFQPTDDMIWDLMTGKFWGSLDYHHVAMRGLTPYAGTEISHTEIRRRKDAKDAEEASKHTRTREEALRIQTEKGELPSPPAEYWSMIQTLIAFTGIVRMVLGENNDLFKQLCKLIEVLYDEERQREKHKYDGVLSRQIFWMVLVETKRYCKNALTPEALRQQHPPFPVTNIQHFLPQISEAQQVSVINFPAKWNVAAPPLPPITAPWVAPAYQPPPISAWGGSPLVTAQAGAYPLHPFLQQQWQGTSQFGTTTDTDGRNKNAGNLPPGVAAALKKVLDKFPQATHGQVLAAAGKSVGDLPKIKDRVTCYNWLLGKCQRGASCRFCHDKITEMTGEHVKEWTEIVEQGAAEILKNNALPRTIGRPGTKRQRKS